MNFSNGLREFEVQDFNDALAYLCDFDERDMEATFRRYHGNIDLIIKYANRKQVEMDFYAKYKTDLMYYLSVLGEDPEIVKVLSAPLIYSIAVSHTQEVANAMCQSIGELCGGSNITILRFPRINNYRTVNALKGFVNRALWEDDPDFICIDKPCHIQILPQENHRSLNNMMRMLFKHC